MSVKLDTLCFRFTNEEKEIVCVCVCLLKKRQARVCVDAGPMYVYTLLTREGRLDKPLHDRRAQTSLTAALFSFRMSETYFAWFVSAGAGQMFSGKKQDCSLKYFCLMFYRKRTDTAENRSHSCKVQTENSSRCDSLRRRKQAMGKFYM